MKHRKFLLPPHITKRLEEIRKSCELATARKSEAIAKMASDDLAAVLAVQRAYGLELIDLLRRSAEVVDDVQILMANSRPPINAEYVLHLVLGKEECEAVIGDLVQEYGRIMQRFGRRHADIWFFKQVMGSLWPFLRRAIVRLGTLVSIVRLLRRLVS